MAGLETLANLPARTIHKHFAWVDGKKGGARLPDAHIPPIVRALCAILGRIEINDWTITADPEGPAFFAVAPIQDREVETREIEEGTASHFEYYAAQYREVYDDFDLIHYFLSDK